jgi:hypothetical protein
MKLYASMSFEERFAMRHVGVRLTLPRSCVNDRTSLHTTRLPGRRMCASGFLQQHLNVMHFRNEGTGKSGLNLSRVPLASSTPAADHQQVVSHSNPQKFGCEISRKGANETTSTCSQFGVYWAGSATTKPASVRTVGV